MRTLATGLTLGLTALLGACQAPATVAPVASGSRNVEAPGFSVQRLDVARISAAEPAALEVAIFQKINAARAALGLGALTASSELRAIAMVHIRDMQTRRYFNHVTPDHKTPLDRMLATGIPFSFTGETSSHQHVGGNTAQVVLDDWRRHPGGWSQVTDARFTYAGVAVVKSGPNEYLVNVVYLRPRENPSQQTNTGEQTYADEQTYDNESGYDGE